MITKFLAQKGSNMQSTFDYHSFFSFDKRIFFLFLCIAYAGLLFINKELILLDSLYFEALGEQLAYERIEKMLSNQKENAWISFCIIPFFLLFKLFIISISIATGLLLANYKLSFKKIFQIVLIADAIFIIPKAIQTTYFLFAKNYTLRDVSGFDFWSVLALIGKDNVPFWLSYPLRTLNIFEISYWFILAFGFTLVIKRAYNEMFTIIISSYGTLTLIWIIFVVFLQVSFAK